MTGQPAPNIRTFIPGDLPQVQDLFAIGLMEFAGGVEHEVRRLHGQGAGRAPLNRRPNIRNNEPRHILPGLLVIYLGPKATANPGSGYRGLAYSNELAIRFSLESYCCQSGSTLGPMGQTASWE